MPRFFRFTRGGHDGGAGRTEQPVSWTPPRNGMHSAPGGEPAGFWTPPANGLHSAAGTGASLEFWTPPRGGMYSAPAGGPRFPPPPPTRDGSARGARSPLKR